MRLEYAGGILRPFCSEKIRFRLTLAVWFHVFVIAVLQQLAALTGQGPSWGEACPHRPCKQL